MKNIIYNLSKYQKITSNILFNFQNFNFHIKNPKKVQVNSIFLNYHKPNKFFYSQKT